MFTWSSRTREFRPSLEISNSSMFFHPITLVINLYFITKIKKITIATLIPTKNQNWEPKPHNFERNGLSNENLFEYSQAPSKKPPKDNLTTKFNPSRNKIITTQRIKTRIQKLKKQSHPQGIHQEIKRQRKALKEDQFYSILNNSPSEFYERYKSVFIDLTKPLGWSYT